MAVTLFLCTLEYEDVDDNTLHYIHYTYEIKINS